MCMAEVYIGNKPATVYFYIARAWSDGRAGMPMFGLTGPRAKLFAGQTVHIGDRTLTVGTDGYIRIPKSVVDEHGVKGVDGRKRVSLCFIRAFQDTLMVLVAPPPPHQKDAQTGDCTRLHEAVPFDSSNCVLVPAECYDGRRRLSSFFSRTERDLEIAALMRYQSLVRPYDGKTIHNVHG